MQITEADLVEKAKGQRRRKRYEESLVSALAAVDDDPESSEAWWRLPLAARTCGTVEMRLLPSK